MQTMISPRYPLSVYSQQMNTQDWSATSSFEITVGLKGFSRLVGSGGRIRLTPPEIALIYILLL